MDYRTFPCPNCREIIDTTMQSCKYCGATVDPGAAASAADLQARVQKACGNASSIRITAGATPLLLLLFFVLTLGAMNLANASILILVPIGAIRWHLLYGSLQSPDPDLPRARRAVRNSVLIWAAIAVLVALWFLFRPLVVIHRSN
ncbi:MAG TPA: hypothetical protein VJA16_14905 [Thermoanaerobaculia bacterium]